MLSTQLILFSLCIIILTATPESFIIGSNILNWTNAKSYCKELGTNLASIHSQSDFNEMQILCSQTGKGCWIGLNDIKNQGIWQWDDKTILDYGFRITDNFNTNPTSSIYPWSKREPSNGINEDCVILDVDQMYKWNDIECSNKYYPICNYPPINKNDICIKRSKVRPWVNGKYKYHSWNNSNNGSIWYSSELKLYLFPWVYSESNRQYLIGRNYKRNKAYAWCRIPSGSKDSSIMSPYDCYNDDKQQFFSEERGTKDWIDDVNTKLYQCKKDVIFVIRIKRY